jgi:integrase
LSALRLARGTLVAHVSVLLAWGSDTQQPVDTHRDVWFPEALAGVDPDLETPERRRRVAAAGCDLRPHDFRHSWVTHLRAAGIDPTDLAEIAGHTVETATARCTHPLRRSDDAVRRVVG